MCRKKPYFCSPKAKSTLRANLAAGSIVSTKRVKKVCDAARFLPSQRASQSALYQENKPLLKHKIGH